MNELITGDSNIAVMQAAKQQAGMKAAMAEKSAQFENIQKIEAAAKDFEAVFLSEMLKPMFAEINEPDPLFGGGRGEQVFNGMMVQEYGKMMAENGGIGIAEHVKAELMKIQEAQNPNTAVVTRSNLNGNTKGVE